MTEETLAEVRAVAEDNRKREEAEIDRTTGRNSAYAAVKPACGCVIAICTAALTHKEQAAEFVSKSILDGYFIDRVSREEAIERFAAECFH